MDPIIGTKLQIKRSTRLLISNPKIPKPHQILLKTHPTAYLMSLSIPIKLLGCSAFIYIRSQHEGNLGSGVVRCIFLGYSSYQKGYTYYFPITKKIYSSMDVTLLKISHIPPNLTFKEE